MKNNDPKPPSSIPAFVRWLRSNIDLIDAAYQGLDINPEWLIELGDRCLEVVSEAADHAARLGLPELQAMSTATPLEVPDVKAFLAQGIALCQERIMTERRARDDGMISLAEAADYCRYTEKGFRKIVDRSQAKRNGARVTGPTVRFSQREKGAKLLFRKEWLDEFMNYDASQPSSETAAKQTETTSRPRKLRHQPAKPSTGSAFGLDYSFVGKG